MKFIRVFLALAFLASPAQAADQWDTTDPAGSSNASDIDTNIIANNEALDRLAIRYRNGLVLLPSSVSTLSVTEGEIAIPDSTDSVVRWRRTTSSTSISWADIDTGAEASATQYYVYATADTDITGTVFKISTSSTAPSGMTYYRKIGYFYNNSSGDITSVGNIKNSSTANIISVEGNTDITTSSTSYADMDNMEIRVVTSGRPLRLSFSGPSGNNTSEAGNLKFTVDGSDYNATGVYSNTASPSNYPFKLDDLIFGLSSASHTVKVQWKADSGRSLTQYGLTDGPRILIAEEL